MLKMRSILNAAAAFIITLAVLLSIGFAVNTVHAGAEKSCNSANYDYMYYGTYPQTEIVGTKEQSGVYSKAWAEEGDYEVDAELYKKLQQANFNYSGEATVDGIRYRRINSSSACETGDDENHYSWSDSTTYHYFRYDKIKWRKIPLRGNSVLMISDRALDCQKYKTTTETGTWGDSTVRDWLNDRFMRQAFTKEERKVIRHTNLYNSCNPEYGTDGGSNTKDWVFLMSDSEVSGRNALPFGFEYDFAAKDPARQCKTTGYAKAMGAYSETESGYLGNCKWWLRTPGYNQARAVVITCMGVVNYFGYELSNECAAVRPTIIVDFKEDPSGTPVIKLGKIRCFKVTGAVRSFKIMWKKPAGKVNGYEIQYSLKPDMSRAETVVVSKSSATSTVVKNLKAKRKYYVRIRTYKNEGGQKYYSAWSKTKGVITKGCRYIR